MKFAVAIPCLLLLYQQSCDRSEQNKVPVAARPSPARSLPAVHRFTLVPNNYGVAFDTQTGQICRTWDWRLSGKQPDADATGYIPQRQFGELSPTCMSIYQQFPSGPESKE